MTWFFHEHKWKRKHNPKLQATSRKPHAPIFRSLKQQAQPEVASDKPQASSTTTLSKLIKKINKENAPPGGW